MGVPQRETKGKQENDENEMKGGNQEADHPHRRDRVRLDGIMRIILGTRALGRREINFKRGCHCSGIGWTSPGQIP
jgi:hypothetical protein